VTSAPAGAGQGMELARSLEESLAGILRTDDLLAAAIADEPLPEETTTRVIELGLHGVALPENAGGLGLPVADRVRLAVVAGRRLVPPWIRDEAYGLAPLVAELAAAGDDALAEPLERAAAGELPGGACMGTLADGELRAFLRPGAEQLAAFGPETAELIDLRSAFVEVEPLPGLDAGHGLSRLRITGADAAHARLDGARAASLHDAYLLALLSDAFGSAERMLEVSVEYAGQREQFGRPIATFQALAHLLAEMALGLEVARAGLGRAAQLAAEPDGPRERRRDALATLAHAVPRAARTTCEGAIQVHGGIGFSWELGLHLPLRRVLSTQYALGGEAASAERVGENYLESRRISDG
jgi:alkylation response protein AidB-like acyl-CoA dehydrogenase